MVKYVYDAWGVCTTVVIDESATDIANLNPFRYRSYYYDIETNLYFLKTRYYDPEICRFITIDDISYLAPDTINGLNLYAYCGNNPVVKVDPNGTEWYNFLYDCVNTVLGLLNPVSTIAAIGAVAVAAIQGRWDDLKYDWNSGALNPINQSAENALNSKVLSFYKGSTVVRQDLIYTCSAFGTIWAETSGVNGTDIRHEFGHSVQERLLGTLYWSNVAIPSVLYFLYDSKIGGTLIDYYSTPWERIADLLGGVNRGNYKKDSLQWGIVENLLGPIVIPFYFLFGF